MILLTGATGYLGSHLLCALVEKGFEVVVLKRSTSDVTRIKEYISKCYIENVDETSLEKIFKRYTISKVVHTATLYGRKQESNFELFESNVYFPLQLAHFGSQYGIETFYNTSTSLPPNLNPYSLSKRHLEEWLKTYSVKFKVINVRPEYFFGPGDDPAKFVSMLIKRMSLNLEIDLSACTQRRDFVYITDLISAYSVLLDMERTMPSYAEFSVGSGTVVSLKKLVLEVAQMMNFDTNKLRFGALPLRDNEVMESVADLRAISSLGWLPKTSIEEGLKLTINHDTYNGV